MTAGSGAAGVVATVGATHTSASRGRRLVLVAAVVLALHVLFVAVRLIAGGGDISIFVAAGDGITDAHSAPRGLLVTPGTNGYDGQAYYRLALDPLTDDVEDHGIAFARPAYWQARIGYPATVWVLSLGGRVHLVPAALVLVNLLATTGIAVLGAHLSMRLGRSAWWGMVPALWAGFLVGLGQDLTEPLAGLLLLAGLVAVRSGRHALAAATLTAAALTRETTLLVAVAVVAAALLASRSAEARRSTPPWWVGAVPLVGYAGWRTWVRARWSNAVPDPPSDNPLGMPGLELLRHLGTALSHPAVEAPNLALLVPAILSLGLAATGLRGEGPRHEKLALAGHLLVVASLPVWDRGQAYLRWGCEPLLLGWLLLAGGGPGAAYAGRVRHALVLLVAVVWLVTATQSLAYPVSDGPWSGWWTWS